MSDDQSPPDRHSAAADAAALRWSEGHPDDDVDHPAPAAPEPAQEGVPNRHSASAESANVRWRQRHDEDPG